MHLSWWCENQTSYHVNATGFCCRSRHSRRRLEDETLVFQTGSIIVPYRFVKVRFDDELEDMINHRDFFRLTSERITANAYSCSLASDWRASPFSAHFYGGSRARIGEQSSINSLSERFEFRAFDQFSPYLGACCRVRVSKQSVSRMSTTIVDFSPN